MAGRDDERVERALLTALESAPRTVMEFLPDFRKSGGGALAAARSEGLIHVVMHRALRAGRIATYGVGDGGLTRYGLPGRDLESSIDRGTVDPSPLDEDHARAALRMASAVRDPADRGRIQADVIAHREQLARDGNLGHFGSAKSNANLLRRVDRGKRTVIAAFSPADFFRRVVLHDGPWILGVVVVFFVVRGLLVEVFRIPSRSMVPALAVGDRVAVWKPAGAPERYSIQTFHRNDVTYVKRLIGFGGEEIALSNGDVFIDGERLTKPDAIRLALRKLIAKWDFRTDSGRPGPGNDWRRVTSHDEVAWIWNAAPLYPNGGQHNDDFATRYGFRIRDGYLHAVGHVDQGGAISVGLTREIYGDNESGPQGRVVLDVGAEGISLIVTGRNEDGSTRAMLELASDDNPRLGTIEIELAYVDGEVHATVGDWTWRGKVTLPDHPLTYEVARRGRSARVSTVRLYADIHYAQNAPDAIIAVPPPGQTDPRAFGHRIPDGHLFFLGDNTVNSNDSRTSSMGDVPAKDLIGPVVFRVWPPSRIGRVR